MIVAQQSPLGEEPLTEEVSDRANKTIIIRDYEDTHQEPDKQRTPPQDPTGHIQGVQGHSALGKVNSELEDIKFPVSKLLLEAASTVPVPNTAQKKQKESQID